MLKGIPSILSPDLLKILMEMGHGDELVLADANFPSANLAQRLIRSDGNKIPELLDAILKFFPLDQYVEKTVVLMAVIMGDPYKPVIWEKYKNIINKYEKKYEIESMEIFSFYERAHRAYAVVATGETAQYGNIILKKGVIKE